MLDSVFKDIRYELVRGNNIKKLIFLNAILFLLLTFFQVILLGFSETAQQTFQNIVNAFQLPVDLRKVIFQPWSIITYSFINFGFWKIIFLLLFLFWFGTIAGDLIGDRRVMLLYLFSVIFGGLIAILCANVLPFGFNKELYLNGAYTGVFGLMMASAILAPDYHMRLFIIGRIKLKYVVLVTVAIAIIYMTFKYRDVNSYAHIGGLFAGYAYIFLLRKGLMPNFPILQQTFSRKKKSNSQQTKIVNLFASIKESELKIRNQHKVYNEDHLDRILEKIKRSGQDSLTKEEKDFLSQYSQKEN